MWLLEVLDDAVAGVQSVLESTYLRRVERAHRLPPGRRQERDRTTRGSVYRDVLYPALGVVVELDGRLGHVAFADRASDLTRDLEAASGGLLTIRLGWQQCELRPCETAIAVAAVFRRRGWLGALQPCSPACAVHRAA